MKVDFLYSIKDEVSIKNLNVLGIVVGLYLGDTGVQYQVSYFADGSKVTTYLYEEQLKKPVGDELGFLK